ncbi:Xaa-His dipeptidase [Peptostreptococcaceae bacterium AS15]|nr:Xaa-His dipeptidase [Peptostreptococcaceae bacterium AS15]
MSLNLEPKEVFDWFYKINQIPRESGHEKEVSDFLVDFAKNRNLEVIQDGQYNVIIKKKASDGYENSKPVIIQGHMDMVCVKEDDSDHDFRKDPIKMIVDGDFLKADRTTLGGDDGIAVAYALAILDGDYKHPALEVLITTSEETGMQGAANIKQGTLVGKRLINIDSEEEGVFLSGCAGGVMAETTFDIDEEKNDLKDAMKITVSGLKGGHSGMMIKYQRANAIKVIFRIINQIRENTDVKISSISGGIKHNAIPDFATAEIAVSDYDKAYEVAIGIIQEIKDEYKVKDENLKVELGKCDVETVFTKELTNRLIDYFIVVKDQVVMMSNDVENLVQTSLNNAILKREGSQILLLTSIRSSVESQLDMMIEDLRVLARVLNAKFELKNRYPAWQFERESQIRDISLSTYKEIFGKEGKIDLIHAGLECGLLKKVLSDCDMISYGPFMYDVHSPREKISISSAKRMWEFTLKLLENLK